MNQEWTPALTSPKTDGRYFVTVKKIGFLPCLDTRSFCNGVWEDSPFSEAVTAWMTPMIKPYAPPLIPLQKLEQALERLLDNGVCGNGEEFILRAYKEYKESKALLPAGSDE
jgi:hypothetical protein